ncbi:hypothetical protein [Frateuria sp. Soil773]|nr:hypothetical protein [Frateuria sp. Soil773]
MPVAAQEDGSTNAGMAGASHASAAIAPMPGAFKDNRATVRYA